MEPSRWRGRAATRPRPFIASGGPSAASLGDLQAVERSLLRGEGPHRRSVFGAPDRALVLCVDEKSQIQALDRSCRCAPGRRSGAATTTSATAVANVSSGPRVPKFLDLVENVPGDLDPHRHGQLRDPQDQGDPRLVRQTAALAGPFHTHQRLLAEPGRALVRAADRSSRSGAASIAPPRSWSAPSSTTSTRQTRTPNPSNGPNPPMTSSAPSSASASEQSKSLNSRRKSCELRNRDTSHPSGYATRTTVRAAAGSMIPVFR